MGETRTARILEYLEMGNRREVLGKIRTLQLFRCSQIASAFPVSERRLKRSTDAISGLYEGCLLEIEGDKGILKGERGAKLFVEGHPDAKKTLKHNEDISFLLH